MRPSRDLFQRYGLVALLVVGAAVLTRLLPSPFSYLHGHRSGEMCRAERHAERHVMAPLPPAPPMPPSPPTPPPPLFGPGISADAEREARFHEREAARFERDVERHARDAARQAERHARDAARQAERRPAG